ncbi:MAG: hypothetical protein Phog2KO_39380 [Phototrophicaceae bacterium]
MHNHILAVHSYGSHRVKNPSTKKMVSAQKIGYTSAAADLLLALYSNLAQDVSSKRASYHYIQITGETTVRHGYLLLKLNDTELAQAETLTKLHQRAGAYLYRDGKWLEMPNQHNPEYSPAVSRSGPNFAPTGYRIVTPANGEKEAAVESILLNSRNRFRWLMFID